MQSVAGIRSDQDQTEVREELLAKIRDRETLILPITAIVETGNFIAQLNRGSVRRKTAELFVSLVRLVVEGRAPWSLHEFEWGADFLHRFLNGADTGANLVDHFTAGLGSGDLCILTERQAYRLRTGLAEVRLWTKDAALSAHS